MYFAVVSFQFVAAIGDLCVNVMCLETVKYVISVVLVSPSIISKNFATNTDNQTIFSCFLCYQSQAFIQVT